MPPWVVGHLRQFPEVWLIIGSALLAIGLGNTYLFAKEVYQDVKA